MKQGKYVTFTDGTALVFPHQDLHTSYIVAGKVPRSAGYFANDVELLCFGQSSSLGVRACEGDEELIRRLCVAPRSP